MILLDTNVLVYAVGEEHPLLAPARRVFDSVARAAVAATTTAGVIQEFAHVFARRRGRAAAHAQALRFTTLLSPMVREDEALAGALELYERYDRLDPFDALLASACIAAGAEALVSGDRGFAEVEGLPFVDLGAPELDRLLR